MLTGQDSGSQGPPALSPLKTRQELLDKVEGSLVVVSIKVVVEQGREIQDTAIKRGKGHGVVDDQMASKESKTVRRIARKKPEFPCHSNLCRFVSFR